MIIFKGKGILILLYFAVSAIAISFINRLLIENFEFYKPPLGKSLIGLILIVTGIWTKLTAESYFYNEEGQKVYLDIVNDLFFIRMKIWGFILPSLGIGLIIYGMVKSFV